MYREQRESEDSLGANVTGVSVLCTLDRDMVIILSTNGSDGRLILVFYASWERF